MYHSIIFGTSEPYIDQTTQQLVFENSKYTYDDWHLIPASRPVIAMPEVVTNFVDIPGMNGSLDNTEAIAGYPVFKARTGTLQFYVENDHEFWAAIYEKILSYLHGKELYIMLEDLPLWYYVGRFEVAEWRSESWNSEINIKYNLNPFRYNIYHQTDDWLWDPFNFETDYTNREVLEDPRL